MADGPPSPRTPPRSVGPPAVTRLKLGGMSMLPTCPPLPPSMASNSGVSSKLPEVPLQPHVDPGSGGGSVEQNLLASGLDNLWSLPEVVSQVAVQHRSHSQEIQAQREHLKHMQTLLAEEQRILDDLTQEIQALHRKVVSGQGVFTQKKKTLQQLQNDLSEKLSAHTDLQCKYDSQKMSLQEFQETIHRYETKMKQHQDATELVDKSNPEAQVRASLLAEINRLKEQRQFGPMDSHKAPLLQAIENMKTELTDVEDTLAEKRTHIFNLRSKRADIQKETAVLHKRNTAQQTRLRRQLKEVQLQQHHWSEEAAQLEAAIAQFRS